MKVTNVLTALALICLPTISIANNLPFVGKRDFHLPEFDGEGGLKQIEITKSGNVKIIARRNVGDFILYKGKYKNMYYLSNKDGYGGHFVKIISKNQIAYTDKYGNILDECGGEDEYEKEYCIANLTKPFR